MLWQFLNVNIKDDPLPVSTCQREIIYGNPRSTHVKILVITNSLMNFSFLDMNINKIFMDET